ncbi:MAG: aromatic ring-hydroxylating dioxygenase subunit alpha [Anaerolineae bacterium]|nr:aromatic ring-hydroxylating dioxygenase subunit alpha [Anaerolineae bacterium]
MIPNQWYVVFSSSQLKRRPIGVTRMGEKLVFWRDATGKAACCRDRCAHRGVQLSKGQRLENGRLQCPFHGFEYDVTGRVQRIPANGQDAPVPDRFKVHAYPTHEAHGFIWIWWGEKLPPDLQPPEFFEDLGDGFAWGEAIDPWQAHYTRVIENQLDAVHLPFVHHNTIGRGNRTLVDGPVVRWVDPNRLVFYTYNRVDDGTPPRRPEEIEVDPERDFHLGFIFPNLWQNYIADDVRVVAAFVPVDEGHTLLYLRFYQRFLRVPGLRKLVAQMAMPFNRVVAHQDRRIVETHQPQRVTLQMGENLIQGDRPVVAYRKRRAELLAAAGLAS